LVECEPTNTERSSTMRYLITGCAGFVGLPHPPLEGCSLRPPGNEVYVPRRFVDRQHQQTSSHLKANDRFHYTIDTVMNTQLTRRARRRRRTSSITSPPPSVVKLIRREPGADDRDQHPRHRGRCWRSPTRRSAPCSSPRRARCTARATRSRFKEDGDLVMGATTKGRWSYAAPRLSTSSSPSPTGRRRSSRP